MHDGAESWKHLVEILSQREDLSLKSIRTIKRLYIKMIMCFLLPTKTGHL
jgi:hypothetical protein